MHRGDRLERNDISYVLIILHVLQAPAVDATGTFRSLKGWQTVITESRSRPPHGNCATS